MQPSADAKHYIPLSSIFSDRYVIEFAEQFAWNELSVVHAF